MEIKPQELFRNSLSNMSSFKNRLSLEEIDKIKEETHDICQLFYPEESWNRFYQ